MVHSHFAVKVREIRKVRGLSQADLARELCVSQQTVSYWERGMRQPDERSWKLLQRCLGYSRAELEGSASLVPLDSRVAKGPASRREVMLPLFRKGTAALLLDLKDSLAVEALDMPQAQRILREALRAKRPVWIVLG